jgi:hypothetical protein
MLAKIISAGALTLLLTGSALAYIPQPQQHNVYAGHSNSQQGANNIGQQYAANTVPYGYNDTQGSHAFGGGPG